MTVIELLSKLGTELSNSQLRRLCEQGSVTFSLTNCIHDDFIKKRDPLEELKELPAIIEMGRRPRKRYVVSECLDLKELALAKMKFKKITVAVNEEEFNDR